MIKIILKPIRQKNEIFNSYDENIVSERND